MSQKATTRARVMFEQVWTTNWLHSKRISSSNCEIFVILICQLPYQVAYNVSQSFCTDKYRSSNSIRIQHVGPVAKFGCSLCLTLSINSKKFHKLHGRLLCQLSLFCPQDDTVFVLKATELIYVHCNWTGNNLVLMDLFVTYGLRLRSWIRSYYIV